MKFENVYFINGTAYAGKSTMVKLLAEKYDGIACEENYQDRLLENLDTKEFPNLTYTRDLQDWGEFVRRTPDEYEAWVNGVTRECTVLEIEILKDLVSRTKKKIFVDTNISVEILHEISDENHVLIMLADPNISVQRFFERPDKEKQFLYQLLLKEDNSEEAMINFRECLKRINSQERYMMFQKSGFNVITRDENRSIDETYTRLKDHEDKKDYWSEAIVFVSQDEHFNKAHVKYLEGRLYDIAIQVDRYTVMNTQKPTSAAIAIDEQAEMEDFIDNITVLTFGMGHKVFEPLIKKDMGSDDLSKKQVFYIKTKNGSVNAKMIRTVEGYVVLKGSKIRESDTKSTPSWAKKKRKQLISEGTIKNGVFLRNELFSSSSGASDVVTGNSTSGKKMWKTETGITLGEIIEQEEQN